MGTMILTQIFSGISIFLSILSTLLFVYMIMTWIVRPSSPVYVFISRLMAPVLAPFRPIAHKLMMQGVMVDLTVLLAMLGVQLLRWALNWLWVLVW